MHNHNDKYLNRAGLEPGTSRLQGQVDTNEPSGPAISNNTHVEKIKNKKYSSLHQY